VTASSSCRRTIVRSDPLRTQKRSQSIRADSFVSRNLLFVQPFRKVPLPEPTGPGKAVFGGLQAGDRSGNAFSGTSFLRAEGAPGRSDGLDRQSPTANPASVIRC
jgi:hypothetical protein